MMPRGRSGGREDAAVGRGVAIIRKHEPSVTHVLKKISLSCILRHDSWAATYTDIHSTATAERRAAPKKILVGAAAGVDAVVSQLGRAVRPSYKCVGGGGANGEGAGCSRCGQALRCGGHGNGGHYLNSVERYDPALDAWEVVAPMAQVRNLFGVPVLDGKLYAVGGYDGDTGNASSSVERAVRPRDQCVGGGGGARNGAIS